GEWVQTLQAGSTRGMSESDAYLQGNPIDQVALGGLLAAAIGVLFVRRSQVVELIKTNWVIFLYIFYCLASAVWSDFPAVSLRRWNRSLGDFVMIMVVLTDRSKLIAIKRFLLRAGFVLVPLSILFIRYI